MSKQPNFFARRWNWHSRVVDFEKKFEAIHPPIFRCNPSVLNDMVYAIATLKNDTKPGKYRGGNGDIGDHYKNRIYMSTVNCGQVKEYLVTFVMDNTDDLYDDVEETKVFETEADAMRCFHYMLACKVNTMFPQSAHRVFLKYI